MPNADLQACVLNVQSSSWLVQFHTITTVRNIIFNNYDLLFQANGFDLRQMVLDMCNLADSVKVPVTMNALMCIGQFAQALRSGIDPCVEQMFTTVFRRCTDYNEYITQKAKKAIGMIAAYCHEQKVLNAIIKNWDLKNHQTKEILGIMIEKIIVRLG